MSNFSEQQAQRDEVKAQKRVRREKLAGYLYDLSKLIFAALVLGGFSKIVDQNGMSPFSVLTVIVGTVSTVLFALIAHRILKY